MASVHCGAYTSPEQLGCYRVFPSEPFSFPTLMGLGPVFSDSGPLLRGELVS